MKVGVVGAGAVARRGHLPTYRVIPEAEVVGIADIDRALAARVAEEFRIPRYCSTCEELLQDDSIQLVDICTPSQTHVNMVKTAAEAGRHILVEKPLAVSLEDALEIQGLVNRNETKLCVAQNYRYFPAAIAARRRILQGYLGRIVTIHGVGLVSFPTHWTLGTWLYHQGGALYDFGPHLIDMILWMKDFAPVKRVYASGGDFSQGNMDFVNYAVINIEFENGSVAVADISWVTGLVFKFALDLYGTGGNLFLDVRNNVSYETRGSPLPSDDMKFFFKKMWNIGTGVLNSSYFKGANAYYKPLIHDFINAVETGGQIPVTVEQAVMTNTVLEAARLSVLNKESINTADLLGKHE
jgi:myo-inositol 2-dehydrogenase/D-chiro-inositol 1-dehydrogenase